MNSRKEIWEIVKLSLDLIDPVLVCQVFACTISKYFWAVLPYFFLLQWMMFYECLVVSPRGREGQFHSIYFISRHYVILLLRLKPQGFTIWSFFKVSVLLLKSCKFLTEQNASVCLSFDMNGDDNCSKRQFSFKNKYDCYDIVHT